MLAHLDKVQAHWVDGRPADTRRSIWSAADIFISLSDNLQETYRPHAGGGDGRGAALRGHRLERLQGHGAPRRGRLPHRRPPRRLRALVATWPSPSARTGWATNRSWPPSRSSPAVDPESAMRARCSTSSSNPDLRRSMGAGGAAATRATPSTGRARSFPQYESLWNELEASAPRQRLPSPPRSRNAGENPWRPDPFRMYGGYSTSVDHGELRRSPPCRVITWDAAAALMNKPLVRLMPQYLPHPDEVKPPAGSCSDGASQIDARRPARHAFPASRRPFLERGVLWMAKYGMLQPAGPANHHQHLSNDPMTALAAASEKTVLHFGDASPNGTTSCILPFMAKCGASCASTSTPG